MVVDYAKLKTKTQKVLNSLISFNTSSLVMASQSSIDQGSSLAPTIVKVLAHNWSQRVWINWIWCGWVMGLKILIPNFVKPCKDRLKTLSWISIWQGSFSRFWNNSRIPINPKWRQTVKYFIITSTWSNIIWRTSWFNKLCHIITLTTQS